MMQTELTKKNLTEVGEAISHELGAQMIMDYQSANPKDVKSYYIGRDIMEEILSQPSCVGLKFYNAYNESGTKTLVYVGLDSNGKSIAQLTVVTSEGTLETKKAIVADRTVQDDTDFNPFEWLLA